MSLIKDPKFDNVEDVIIKSSALVPGGCVRRLIEHFLTPTLMNPEYNITKFELPPQVNTQIIYDELGRPIGMKRVVRHIVAKVVNTNEDNLPGVLRSYVGSSNVPNYIDINPIMRLLSMLYAFANNDFMALEKLVPSVKEDIDTAKVLDVIPNEKEIVNDIDTLINNLEDILNDPKKVNDLPEPSVVKKLEEAIRLLSEVEKSLEYKGKIDEKMVDKVASGKIYLSETLVNKFRKEAKKLGYVQTYIPKLYKFLEGYSESVANDTFNDVKQTLKSAIFDYNLLTINDKEFQKEIYNNLKQALFFVNATQLHDMIYNSNRLISENNVIHIDGIPIDLELVKDMTKEDMTKAISPTFAELICVGDKVDSNKFVEVLNKLLEASKTDESIKNNIIDPILNYFRKVGVENVD